MRKSLLSIVSRFSAIALTVICSLAMFSGLYSEIIAPAVFAVSISAEPVSAFLDSAVSRAVVFYLMPLCIAFAFGYTVAHDKSRMRRSQTLEEDTTFIGRCFGHIYKAISNLLTNALDLKPKKFFNYQ